MQLRDTRLFFFCLSKFPGSDEVDLKLDKSKSYALLEALLGLVEATDEVDDVADVADDCCDVATCVTCHGVACAWS